MPVPPCPYLTTQQDVRRKDSGVVLRDVTRKGPAGMLGVGPASIAQATQTSARNPSVLATRQTKAAEDHMRAAAAHRFAPEGIAQTVVGWSMSMAAGTGHTLFRVFDTFARFHSMLHLTSTVSIIGADAQRYAADALIKVWRTFAGFAPFVPFACD
ncbi:uncharacterized protein LAESUDRAFT_763791 [Laetiporus sulphureus 93-53]|uniref:Uncharacterized protein n=1 Tax=Laetiporus sulphureus 93-53 TaxID=1314785 RepID=A0A165BPB0_9APHY|nr:uncharacterized protein LAESUDRAFT_763791 [Laetiporus sulphureus 93-53]KZT01411.1 hypothetical protein LAESUDRAFT_763791 [Laetiporus sulphureus 93-53]